MTWNAFHQRDTILRAVITTADARLDGILPLDVPGVTETFADDLAVLSALQLRWHTRLAGRIERTLMGGPPDAGAPVVSPWQETADELPGIRAIIDHYAAAPTSAEMSRALAVSAAKERQLLAGMTALAS